MSPAKDIGPTTYRPEALTDCIFSIAMTLLVLTITIPHVSHQEAAMLLPQALMKQLNDLFNYVLSFLLLAVFWMLHHKQFHFIKRTDAMHLWINIVMLMFVTLIPYTASLISFYPQLLYTNLFFHTNMFMIGLMFYLDWSYATHGGRLLLQRLPRSMVDAGKMKSLVVPAVALIAMVVAVLTPAWSPATYVLIPLLQALFSKR